MFARIHKKSAAGWVMVLLLAAALSSHAADNARDDFQNLPEAKRQELGSAARTGGINEGTAGLTLPGVRASGASQTIAILGDLAPSSEFSAKYLSETASQLNLLRPDAVFTVGNLIPGLTRSGQTYARQVNDVRADLDTLKMPWYPCAGTDEVVSGTRDPTDRRFESLYQKYFGPLYYSVNLAAVHVVVLDSEEGVGKGDQISDAQLAWLKTDLNKTFETRRTRYVVVLLHRPLWRDEGSNWPRVHELLADFNRRPIVSVEGVDAGGEPGGGNEGPRVFGVYAGSTCAYSQEPTRDGIHYTVLGATAAHIDQDNTEMIRGFTVLRFDAADSGSVQAAVIQTAGHFTPQTGGPIVPDDIVTARERTILDAIANLPGTALGVEGVLGPSGGAVTLHAENPLAVPLDIEIRLASAKNISDEAQRENVNPFVESLDAPWEMATPHLIRHLDPGAKEKWQISFTNEKGAIEIPPPQVEFLVHWSDPRGRMHTIVVKRKVPVAPVAEIPAVAGVVGANAAFTGDHFVSGGLYTWNLHGDEPREKSPEWDMAADDQNVYLRVRVTSSSKSYSPAMQLDDRWGGLASDAVYVAWVGQDGKAERVWIFPFGPKGLELWQNQGLGGDQTDLVRMDDKAGIQGQVVAEDKGYVVMLALPRARMFGSSSSARMNIGVNKNEGGAKSWQESWGLEDKGISGWGMVSMKMGG